MRGQSVVEFALTLPILMMILLGFAELAFLVAEKQAYQNGVEVLSEWAASEMAEKPNAEEWHDGWQKVVNEEAERVGCDGQPVVTFPDDTHLPGDRVLVHWTCTYEPRIVRDWVAFPVVVEHEAVVPGALPPPTPSSSPS